MDNHFQKAGFSDEKIIECHGRINFLQCLEANRCCLNVWPMTLIEVDMTTFKAKDPLPKCNFCGGIARPNILMFGDIGWVSDKTDEQYQRLQETLLIKKWKMAVVELGAGDSVYTVRAFGEKMIYKENATLIRINPSEEFSYNKNVINIKMGALEALQAIDSLIKQET